MFVVTCVSSAFLLFIPFVGAQLKVRLVNGTAPWNGRLEILYNGTWGTVCGYDFGKEEAIVACRMLGFNTSQALAVSSLFYGEGSGPVVFDDLMCTGKEISLDHCKQRKFYWDGCSQFNDVGIVCNTQPVRLRLRDTHGIRRDRGRVEMEVGGQWSALCMSRYTAPVVCRQLGFSYGAMLTNESIPVGSLYGYRELPANMIAFYCLGDETQLFECEQKAWYGSCQTDYSIICGESPYLRVAYEKHLYPPLEGTNITLECDSPQSGQSNVDYWWRGYSRQSGKYLTFNKVSRHHQGRQVNCMANYIYDGFTYWVVSDALVMQVCCAPSLKSTNTSPPELLYITGDEGHLNVEMTAHPTPHLKNMVYLGQVLNESIEGKNIENLPHDECYASLVSRASVTCSITVFNISQIPEGFYKIAFSNSLGNLPFIFTVNQNIARTGEKSRVFWIVCGSSVGGVVTVTVASIFLVCRCKNRYKSRVTNERYSKKGQAGVRLEEIPARGVTNVYHENKTDDRGTKTRNAEEVDSYPIYVNTAELFEEKDHIYSNV